MSRNVKVKLFAQFSEIAGKKELEIQGKNVREILEKLVEDIEELEPDIFEDISHEHLVEDIIIIKDGRNIDYLEGLDTEVEKGDKISVFPVVGGG